jgi:gamma-glutamyltranspeptidase/glutathione hydrolase
VVEGQDAVETALDPREWDRALLDALLIGNGANALGGAAGGRWAAAAQFPFSAYAAGRALEVGGSAADAFVVAALADCVLTPGASSLGGMAEVIIRQRGGETAWIDGGYRVPLAGHDPADDDWQLLTTTGRAPLVPGVVAALHELWDGEGRLAWPTLFSPALHLASEGFPAYGRLAAVVAARRDVLTDEAARAAYVPGGHPISVGELVVQPALADTLREIARDGVSAMYGGAWAEEAVARTRAGGGVLVVDDFAQYAAPRTPTLDVTHRDWTVHATGTNTGGPSLLRALKVCEALDLRARGRREEDGFSLFAEMQADAYAWDPVLWADPDEPGAAAHAAINDALSVPAVERVAGKVATGVVAGVSPEPPGTHAIAVVDGDGLVVTGTHSITWRGWGTGLFVGGVALNVGAYMLTDRPTRPGGRTMRSSACVIAHRPGRVVGMSAATAPLACLLQALLDVADRGDDLLAVASRPRWGAAAFDTTTGTNTPHLHAELRITAGAVEEATRLGQPVVRADAVGQGSLIAVGIEDGTRSAVADPRFRGMACAG